MVVTEIALLRATAPTMGDELRQCLERASDVQQQWIAQNLPGAPSAHADRGEGYYQQVEDPAKILLTCTWDSVAAHWKWIVSPENQAAIGSVSDLIENEGENKALLMHLDSDIFSKPAPSGKTHLFQSPLISVSRLQFKLEDKEAAAAKFAEVTADLERFTNPHLTRWGWVVDMQDESKAELVIVMGCDTADDYRAFHKESGWTKYQELLGLSISHELGHYKRFL